MSNKNAGLVLERLENGPNHDFAIPSKCINDREDLDFFFRSSAYRDITTWLLQLDRAMFPSRPTGDQQEEQIDSEAILATTTHVVQVRGLLDDLAKLIAEAPPDTGPRRFGNVAYRTWYRLAEESSISMLRSRLHGIIESIHLQETGGSLVLDELKAYLVGSFGSAQRLDYGTGHELSFLAFLGCLWKLGAFKAGQERAIVIEIIKPYLELVRKLILTYTLEPAGSHGVWGLDDHSFLPYIFGSAQLGPPMNHDDLSAPIPTEGSLSNAPPPASITDKAIVAKYSEQNMYFSAVQFIYDVKKGPFGEHSPVLYNISGIKDGWGKINKGMLKMYAAEVLGKFPVVQHFPFGSLFQWQKDPQAPNWPTSTRNEQLPAGSERKELPSTAQSGTAAPWSAAGGAALPQMHTSTGLPSMRGPRTGNTAPGRYYPASATAGSTTTTTTIPLPRPGHNTSSGLAGTAAPRARPGDQPR